jgi:hypothetical protein
MKELTPSANTLKSANSEITQYGKTDIQLEIGTTKFDLEVTVADIN